MPVSTLYQDHLSSNTGSDFVFLIFSQSSQIFSHQRNWHNNTAKRILERLHHCLSNFDMSVFLILKPISYFLGIYMACFFYLETIGVREIMIWWLAFEKKPFQFWREIWIQVVAILLQLYILKALLLNWFGFYITDPENHSAALWYYNCILPIFYFFIWCLYSNWQNDWFSCIKYAQKTRSKLRLEKTDLAENWIQFNEQVYS